MKLVCISDTHTYGPRISVPDGDILIHAGDHTFRGTEFETEEALAWLESLPHAYKLIVAGNHDFFFDERFPSGHVFRSWAITRHRTVAEMLAKFPSVTYLQDSSAEIAGIKFFGSPWVPWFGDWAFNFPRGDDGSVALEKRAEIPRDTQVLITHSAPYGILDAEYGYNASNPHFGCPALRSRIDELPRLRLHVFGHLHSSYGRAKLGQIELVNAAINTRDYEPTNEPVAIDFEAAA